MFVLGVDLGTTGVKTTAFDENAKVCAYSYEQYPIKEDEFNNHYEIDIDFLVTQAIKTIHGTIDQLNTKEIAAICVTSFGETFVLIDKEDKVLFNPILYMDIRGDKEAEILADQFGNDFFVKHAGTYTNGMYSLSKMKWLADNKPQVISEAEKMFSVASYVLFRLGAEVVMDYSLAARTLAFDIHSKQWLKQCFEYVGLDEAALPSLVPTGSTVGRLNSELKNQFGLINNPLLIIGGHDQVAGAVGGGIYKAGQSVNTIGTTDCLTFTYRGDQYADELAKYNLASVPYLDSDLFVSYAFNMTGGAILNWFTKVFKSPEKDALKILDSSIPKEPSNILILPNFSGSGTPDLNPNDIGVIAGLTVNSSVNDIYKACLEGISFAIKRNIEVVKSIGVDISQVRSVGGGAKSDVWMQIRSNIFNLPVETLEFNEAGTLGSAIMSLHQLGVFSSIEEASASLVSRKKYFEPEKDKVRQYQKLYEEYLNLLKNIKK
ncbi:MAG TPA: hypothetical protein GXZ43_07560 [Clostridiaceae bacterium]|nr:hypothetical protein [Clostridiaceae bacterium]